MSQTQNRPTTELVVRPQRTGPRRRSPGDPSTTKVLSAILVLLAFAAILGAYLSVGEQLMRGAQ